jgi:hypothetical protein
VAQIQGQKWCRLCGRKTLHSRPSFSNTLGCVFSVLTLGLFIPVWLLIGVGEALLCKWRCQVCGGGKWL